MNRIALSAALFGTFAACACLATQASADVATLRNGLAGYAGAADATLFEIEVINSSGGGPTLFVGMTSSAVSRRALIRFDLTEAIPEGSTIESAALTLNVAFTVSTGADDHTLHRMLADWGEGSVNSGETGGMGLPADPGDATWNFAFFDTVPWDAEGGDFIEAPSASQALGTNGDFTFEGEGLTADVQSWVDDPAQNHGWALLGDETGFRNARRIVSSDVAEPRSPRLTVTYHVRENAVPSTRWTLFH